MLEIVSLLVAAVILLSIAFPKLLPERKSKKKLVASSYWGNYDGAPAEAAPDQRIEIPSPGRRHRVVAGSSNYNNGKVTRR